MPRNWAAEEQEFARAEQEALDRLSALRAELQRLLAEQRRLPGDLLQGLDQAASAHKAACQRHGAFAERAARAAASEGRQRSADKSRRKWPAL
mgnify:CR=1 FL=1